MTTANVPQFAATLMGFDAPARHDRLCLALYGGPCRVPGSQCVRDP
jgi:hypothetical protein